MAKKLDAHLIHLFVGVNIWTIALLKSLETHFYRNIAFEVAKHKNINYITFLKYTFPVVKHCACLNKNKYPCINCYIN